MSEFIICVFAGISVVAACLACSAALLLLVTSPSRVMWYNNLYQPKGNKMENEINNWIEANRVWSFEGDSGVRRFGKLVKDMGDYNSIEEFLADNSGAIQAVIEWMGTQRSPEWKENMAAYAELPEDGEEDEG